MADYIFIRKSRNALSSLIHILLNLLLAVISISATVLTGNCLIGLILVFISKWRVFAVNHRYWWLNIRSSLIDFIVGISFILLAFAAGTTFLPVHFVLMAAYAIWLIWVKPASSMNFTVVQSLIAIILGVTTASIFAAITNDIILVAACFLIGFAASNHVLVQSSNVNTTFASLVFALFFSEFAWLSYSWLILYTLGSTGICVSQLSLILATLSFAYFQIFAEYQKNSGKFKFSNVALPIVFCLLVIIVLVVGFSQPRFNIV